MDVLVVVVDVVEVVVVVVVDVVTSQASPSSLPSAHSVWPSLHVLRISIAENINLDMYVDIYILRSRLILNQAWVPGYMRLLHR